jgi:hypothetical protein
MLDYPKLEEYKKGGRVKIINNSIVKKKKMKQKQTQKQIVNVYTHAPKRTYRKQVKKVEPIQQRSITLAPVRAELPSYIYSKPSSTLPTLNPPQALGLPTLPQQQLATNEQEDKLKESSILYDMMRQITKMKNFQQNQEQKIKEKTEKLPTFSDTPKLPDLYEPLNNNLPSLPALPSNNDAKEEPKEPEELPPEVEPEEVPSELEKNALIQDAISNDLYNQEDVPDALKMTDKELLNDISEYYDDDKIVVEYVSQMKIGDLQELAELNGIDKQINLKNSLTMRDKSRAELRKELNAKGIFNNLQLLTPS